jgi:hypothetical protein
MVDPKTFAESTLQLLQQSPGRYHNFGVYWYFVKALMKRYYTKDNLHILGEYMDADTMARMPEHATLQEAIEAAIEEYRHNASFNLGRSTVEDLTGGGVIVLHDEDAGV